MTNCGCSDECVTPKGTASYVYIVSADDNSGTNYTYPANPSQAYIGILSTVFAGVPNISTPGQLVWMINPQAPANYLPQIYVISSNTPFTPPADASTFHQYLQLASLPAGTYKVWFTCEATNNVNDGSLDLIGQIQIFSNGTPSTDTDSLRSVNLCSSASNYITANMATDSDKIVVAANGTITLSAHLNNISRSGFTINRGTLTAMLVHA